MPRPLDQPLLRAHHDDDDDDEWGVLLYYKFVALADPARVADYLRRLCASLSLRGRVRVAPDGLNVTVTGTMPALRAHISALLAHPRFALPAIDFKLSTAPPFAAVPPHLALACGFASLSVRLVPHLITLASDPPPISAAGPLLSPLEFHSLLQYPSPNCVLLDARNIYETRIGTFRPPPHVQFLDPGVRQYSDLPGWIDAHQEQLRNKRVLMYCTGGVRCELASSYLRSKGKEFEDVIQLSGGIHRYMEAFADGGYFKGKNFVFDHRMAVATSNDEVVGRCLLCEAPFDDYSARHRCSLCRLLVLICKRCQGTGGSTVKYVCELCEANQKAPGQPQQTRALDESIINDVPPPTTDKPITPALQTPLLHHEGRVTLNPKLKLRVLCLHGFRQNASSFKGRLRSLQKKLKHTAEFVFVDAPHKLPFMGATTTTPKGTPPTLKYAWLVSPIGGEATTTNTAPFDACQYKMQTQGWDASWEYLQTVFRDLGPFDGVLGFSQGAAVAAALCLRRQCPGGNADMNSDADLDVDADSDADANSDTDANSDAEVNSDAGAGVQFKFAVLCSGYPPPLCPLPEKKKGLDPSAVGIACPSLHIYGGQDRQIGDQTSEQLAAMFPSDERTVVKHACGHIIPTQPEYVEQYVRFLSRFL